MKQLVLFAIALYAGCVATSLQAQTSFLPERDSSTVSLFEYATKIEKRNNVFDLNLELHADFDATFTAGRADRAAFRFKHIKVEATGEVNDRLFYWYRQQLNGSSNDVGELSNLPASIEYAFIGYHFNSHFTVTAGQQPADFGGYEYDLNPLLIYEYSDMNNYTTCFLPGVSLAYQLTPTQELRLQALSSRIGSMEDTYGRLPEGVKASKLPLLYTLAWNSSYLNELLSFRYSVSAAEQARGMWMYSIFAGNKLSAGNFSLYVDAMYNRAQLDPLGVLTSLSLQGDEEAPCFRNTAYFSLVSRMEYRFHPKWNLFAQGMYETASVYKAVGKQHSGNYRTAWGYQGGMEFYPMADDNLRFYLLGSGRTYALTEKAKALDASEENTARLAVGFIYKLPLF